MGQQKTSKKKPGMYSYQIRPGYYKDSLEKRICWECGESFIVGLTLFENAPVPCCPYCGGKSTEAECSLIDKEELLDLECMGISFEIGNEEAD